MRAATIERVGFHPTKLIVTLSGRLGASLHRNPSVSAQPAMGSDQQNIPHQSHCRGKTWNRGVRNEKGPIATPPQMRVG
jgi:hypothetical protein